MNDHCLNDRSAIRFRCYAASAALAATAAILTLIGGCQEHADDSGHDHGTKTPANSDDHALREGDEHGSEAGGGHHGEGEHSDEVTLSAEVIKRYGITTEPARLRVLKPTIAAPARVAFNTEAMAHVGSPLRGRAVDIKARLGDTVKRGDVLLVVESPELGEAQAEYFQKRIAAQTAVPGVDLAKVSWERARGLYEESQGISLTEVQKREAEYKAAVAAQRAAEAAVVGGENRLHLLGMSQAAIEDLAKTGEIAPRYVLHAPLDGQVVEREVTLGELVSPDREALMVLANTGTLWVLADMPEARLHEVAVGAPTRIFLGVASGAGQRSFEGRVTFIAPLIDAGTRTAQVRIEVPSDALALKPGMFAQVEITASDPATIDPTPTIAVPDEAVQTLEGSPAVFVPVQGEPGTFARRAVTVGPAVGGWIPVLAGLVEGEEYVVGGTFILKAELGKGSAAHEH
ncbi:MAG: efflux RND transporter periplasmic adaptor subunit [Phycisphaerales bacterium]|nr:efflux RND transporter periplasmic adaptor subunit [Phycisphaerales bacterium]